MSAALTFALVFFLAGSALAAPKEIAPGSPPAPLTAREREAAKAAQAKQAPQAGQTGQTGQSAKKEQPPAAVEVPPDVVAPSAESGAANPAAAQNPAARKVAPAQQGAGFSGAAKAPAPPPIFISTLSSVPGKKLERSFGFHCQVVPYSSGDNYFARMAEAMDAISVKGRNAGANGFINMRLEAVSLPPLVTPDGKRATGKTVQGVPIPPELTDEGAPPQVVIHVCGDFVRIE